MLFVHKLLKKIELKLQNRNTRIETMSNPKSKFYSQKYKKSGDKIKIEFYLMDSFEIYHFLPIFNELAKILRYKAIFVCEPINLHTCGKWFDYENAKRILNTLHLPYKEVVNSDAEIAISTQNIRTLKKYNKIKVNLQYGTGFNKNNFCNSLKSITGYDYRLAYSDYTKKNLKGLIHPNRIYCTGLSKQDEYYKNLPQKKEYNTNKPILMYFPTWDDDSSINLYYDELMKLKSQFFIITKAHHCTFRLESKKDDLKKLYDISDIVLEGNSSFANAAIQSDLAIIDAKSGAATEVPYLNPNMKILYLSTRKNINSYFYKDLFKFGYIINNPKFLSEYIYKINKFDKYKNYRKKTINYYMNKFDGKATQRAISAIKDIVKTEYGF